MKWHTEIRKISELKEWENNPRTISDKAYQRLKEAIEKRGFHDIIKIDENNVVLSGNQRLKILKELGYKEVECKVPDGKLTQKQKEQVALESNIQDGEWDMDKLANEFEDILEELGFDDLLPEVELEVKEDDYEEPEDLETTVVLGDIYQLGEHRLMCGDSTKIEDVEKLMNGEKADMVFTDPPYNVGLKYQEYKDSKSSTEYETFCSDYLANCLTFSPFVVVTVGKSNEAIYYKNHEVIDSAVWFKKFGLTHGTVYRAMVTEPILFFGTKPTDKFLDTDHLEFITDRESGVTGTHACPKPVGLSAKLIETFSENSVLDLFGGSGSTLIACEQTNRKCYMMEIDPYYCQVIIDRWEKFTGKEAIKLED